MVKQQTGILQYRDLVLQKVKQNYQSIALGGLVLLVALSVIVRLSTQSQKTGASKSKGSSDAGVQSEEKSNQKTYTVKKGDNLWMIAEKQYGSGYNAVDIAKANKIKNPDIIEVGSVFTIPAVKAKKPTKGIIAQAKTTAVTIKEDKYTVKTGDILWNIALQAYGDGYQWIKIARENKLSNPDVIHKNNILTIPR